MPTDKCYRLASAHTVACTDCAAVSEGNLALHCVAMHRLCIVLDKDSVSASDLLASQERFETGGD